MDWCLPGGAGILVDDSQTTLECDYDKSATNLYKAIERGEWDSILTFLATRKWSFMSFSKDVLSPESQTRTWVTRFDPNGKVRWSQLPLHAAIIFHAPTNLVRALIQLYPLSVQCTDDQRMLPLHLAFRVGARDSIMNLLIRSFPEALVTENLAGNKPYEIMQTDTRKEYTECVQHIVKFITHNNATSSQQKSSEEKTNESKDAKDEQSEHVEELKIENRELEQELSDAKIDVAILKERCRMLERIIAENKLATVREPTTKTASGNILGTKDIEKSVRQKRDPSPNSSVSDSLNDLSKFRRQHFVVANNLKSKEKQRDDYDEKSRNRFTGANKLKPVEKEAPVSQHGNTSAKSSVDPKPTQYYKEADICWNEIRQTICSSSEIVSRFQSKDVCNSSEIVSRFQSKDVCNSSEIVSRFQTKDADTSVISSVDLNSVKNRERPFDDSSKVSTNVANTLDTKDMESTAGLTTIESSINASATFATATSSLDPSEHKERDACWTEIREQISNVTDFPLKFDAIDAKSKLENNFESSAMKESAETLMKMVPKENETGLDKETIVRYLRKYKDRQPRKHAYRNSKIPDGEETYLI